MLLGRPAYVSFVRGIVRPPRPDGVPYVTVDDYRSFPDDFQADTIHDDIGDIIIGVLRIIFYF